MIRLQKYDFAVKYMPGRNMVLADTLSRAPISHAVYKHKYPPLFSYWSQRCLMMKLSKDGYKIDRRIIRVSTINTKMIALKPGDTVWVKPLGRGKCMGESKVVDTYRRNSFIIEIDGRGYRRSRVLHRKSTSDLDKAECNMYPNGIIPFRHEKADEATSEEKSRESNVASSSSAETMIKDGVIVKEEETVANATNSSDTDTSYATERNPRERRPLSFMSQHYEIY